MKEFTYPNHPTGNGYLTESTRDKYITSAIGKKLLPENAHRMADIVSLSAPNDITKPIQFWQLFSVLGQEHIVNIVANFYTRVFNDEQWFRVVFERVGPISHHINTQAAMWIDVMGAGPIYHGGDFRLNFHHTHNAIQLMNEKGAKRWVKLMVEALDASNDHMTNDPRVRLSINTFLTHFFGKYAEEFKFENLETFGETNATYKRKINFMNMTNNAVEALSEDELKDGLISRGIDISQFADKTALVSKALSL